MSKKQQLARWFKTYWSDFNIAYMIGSHLGRRASAPYRDTSAAGWCAVSMARTVLSPGSSWWAGPQASWTPYWPWLKTSPVCHSKGMAHDGFPYYGPIWTTELNMAKCGWKHKPTGTCSMSPRELLPASEGARAHASTSHTRKICSSPAPTHRQGSCQLFPFLSNTDTSNNKQQLHTFILAKKWKTKLCFRYSYRLTGMEKF